MRHGCYELSIHYFVRTVCGLVDRVLGCVPQISAPCSKWCGDTAFREGGAGPTRTVHIYGVALPVHRVLRPVACTCHVTGRVARNRAAIVLGCAIPVVRSTVWWEELLLACAVCTKRGEG